MSLISLQFQFGADVYPKIELRLRLSTKRNLSKDVMLFMMLRIYAFHIVKKCIIYVDISGRRLNNRNNNI